MSNRPRIQISQSLRLELNSSLQTALAVLRTDAAGLTKYLEEQAAENPHLRLDPVLPAPGDWLPRWTGAFEGGSGARLDPDMAASASPSLIAHVTGAIDRMALSRVDRRIAQGLAEALEPTGWLGRSPGEIAQEESVPAAQVEAVLTRLQTIEPAGLFARNLAECLRLQVQELGAMSPRMEVVLDNLPLLATGGIARLARLARLARCTEAEITACFRLIRGLNPKPGASFAGGTPAPPVREPDLLARPLPGGGWEIALNRSTLPAITVRRAKDGSEAALARARSLSQAVEARNSTLLRVGREIAARQQAALDGGAAALAPMTMADLATALDLHESTISRVVAGASLDTPRGTWWLRRMFSPARAVEGGAPISAAALRHRIARLVAAENPAQPLTDAALAQALAAETGVSLPRRTLAKYREDAGIPPRPARRRVPEKKPRG